MSWEGGERPARRWTTLAVIAACLLAVLVVGTLVRQGSGAEPEQLTVERSPPPPPPPEPEPTPPEEPASSPSAGEVQREQLEPLLLGRTGLFLHVIDQQGALTRVDLDTGELVEVDLFPGASEDSQLVPDGAGGVVAVAVDYEAQQDARYVGPSGEPSVALGAASAALPSATPGHVWLLDQDGFFPGAENRVREVAYDGTVAVDATLPAGVTVLAGVPGGLLLDAAGTLVRWDPATETGERVGGGRFVAGDARLLARRVCTPALRCWLEVGPIDEPDATRVELAQPEALALADVFFLRPILSADGARLALLAFEGDARAEPRPAVLDLVSGDVRWAPPEVRLEAFGRQVLALSPSGEWLFVAAGQDVVAWNVDDGRIVRIDLPRGTVAAVSVQ